MTRSGRRPGQNETREDILGAARQLFAERGYDRTSMRAIAAEAGVDQALIAHYFGSKQQLFVAVVELPFEPSELLPDILRGDRGSIGERLARQLVGMLEDEDARARITGLLRAAASEPQAAHMVREFLARNVWAPAAAALGVDDGDLRVNLVAAQIVGLVMARYIVAAEPLASLPASEVAALIAPTLQRLLTEPLPSGTDPVA